MPDFSESLDATGVALFLDVDGTLLELRDNPADVVADPGLVAILNACIAELGGAMSLVSGRPIADIDRIFAPAVFPAAGAHGAELRVAPGHEISAANEPLPDGVLERLDALAAGNDGLIVERKRGGASLHYRKAPDKEAACRELVNTLMAELGATYRLIAGKMVFEIAPAAHSKGSAIRTFLDEPPFAGRVPVFLGDDVTDEDGFRVVNDLAGVSIRVGDDAETDAQYRLHDVASVRHWLRNAILVND